MSLQYKQTGLVVQLKFTDTSPIPLLNFRSIGIFSEDYRGTPLETQDYLTINSLEVASKYFNPNTNTYKAIASALSQMYKPTIIYVFSHAKNGINHSGENASITGGRSTQTLSELQGTYNVDIVQLNDDKTYKQSSDTGASLTLTSDNVSSYDKFITAITEGLKAHSFNDWRDNYKDKITLSYDSVNHNFKLEITNKTITQTLPVALNGKGLNFVNSENNKLAQGAKVVLRTETRTLPAESLAESFNRALNCGVFFYGVGFTEEQDPESVTEVIQTIQAIEDSNPKLCIFRHSQYNNFLKGGSIEKFANFNFTRGKAVYQTTTSSEAGGLADFSLLGFITGNNYLVTDNFGSPYGKRLIGVEPEDVLDTSPFENTNSFIYGKVQNTEFTFEFGSPFVNKAIGDFLQNKTQVNLLDLFARENVDIYSKGHELVYSNIESVLLQLNRSGAIVKGTWFGATYGNIQHGEELKYGYKIYYLPPSELTEEQAIKGVMQNFSVGIIPIRYARAVNVTLKDNL